MWGSNLSADAHDWEPEDWLADPANAPHEHDCTCNTHFKEIPGGLNHHEGCSRRTACGAIAYNHLSAFERRWPNFSQWASCLRPRGHEGEHSSAG